MHTNSLHWTGFKHRFCHELFSFNIDKSQLPTPINTDGYIRSKELDTRDITLKGLVSIDLYCCQKETQTEISGEIVKWMKGNCCCKVEYPCRLFYYRLFFYIPNKCIPNLKDH